MKLNKEQLRKWDKKTSRELELEESNGWVAKHKIFRSKKTYNRKLKHGKHNY